MTYALVIGIWRRIAAYRGTQDGTQHRKRHPGGTNSRRMGAPLKSTGVGIPFSGCSGKQTVRMREALCYRPPAPEARMPTSGLRNIA